MGDPQTPRLRRRRLSGLAFAQKRDDVLEHLPHHLRVRGYEGAEGPLRQAVVLHLAVGDDVRAAPSAVDQGQLAEAVTGTEVAAHFSMDADGRLALADDEEARRARSGAGHWRAAV